jgi:hypothetical protein
MPQPAPAPKKRPGWVLPVIGGLVVLLLAAGGAIAYLLVGKSPAAPTGPTALRKAYDFCHAGEIADGDMTIIMDTGGEKSSVGDSFTGIVCTLDFLRAPSAIRSEIEHTRALDGRQTATWDHFEASWTYHPDSGLDLIVRQVG